MSNLFISAHTHNFEPGRREREISLVIFRLLVGTLEEVDAAFSDPNRLASAHYGIRGGTVHQYVKEEDTAYHAETFDKNLISLGIVVGREIGGTSDATYQTAAMLLEEFHRKYRIPLDPDHVLVREKMLNSESTPQLDIARIIREAKDLSPQSVMQKLKKESENNYRMYMEERKRNTAIELPFEAKLEELRRIIREKDDIIQTRSTDLIMLNIKNAEYQIALEKQKSRIISFVKRLISTIKERFKRDNT